MKRNFLTFFFLIIASVAFSQNISVESFKALPNDLDARVHHPLHDQNGELCAIIKVVTPLTDFEWEPDGLGMMAALSKTGEYWLYVPRGARRITIKHPQLGVFRNYQYPVAIGSALVYEMVLTTAEIEVVVKKQQEQWQWLTINTTPEGASVFIDEQLMGLTPHNKRYLEGTYTYLVEMPNYYPVADRIELKGENQVLDFELKPAFGKIQIASIPEDGMMIYHNGENTGLTTPDTLDFVASGDHQIKLVSSWFYPQTKTVTVKDEDISFVLFDMQYTDFSMLTVHTEPEAEIYIDEKYAGEGSVTTRMLPGLYEVSARLENHYTAPHEVMMHPKLDQEITLNPAPRVGSVDIISVPYNARIYIDDKYYGNTPVTIEDLLVGDYKIKLSLDGYGDIIKTFEVIENNVTSIVETMPEGMRLSVTSDPAGADLYLNNVAYGKTPVNLNIVYGDYILKLVNDQKIIEEELSLNKRSKNDLFYEFVEFEEPEMVIVQSGTFSMGCSREQSRFCAVNEKPVQQILLNNYFISKYPITQRQWESVMENKPEQIQDCPDCPITLVSWYEVQEFIERINLLTGKKYRLPTEAEWEYAARGGRESKSYLFSGSSTLQSVGWYSGNSHGISPVGGKKANELGLHDMSGSVWEWCQDWYDNYTPGAKQNPSGPANGTHKVARGGAFPSDEEQCRVSSRNYADPSEGSTLVGFRLVLAPW